MKRTALLSVSDRTGLHEFARALVAQGFDLLTTSGTGKFLREHQIDSLSIEDYTGQSEIFGGRVKTLHPKIYAGILARREIPEDLAMLERDNIRPIEVVAVNLYPFREALEAPRPDHEMVELVDIGGPSMIRAAAKNHASVFPLIDPQDYERAIRFLGGGAPRTEEEAFRRELAAKVFATLSDDSLAVASYLSGQEPLARRMKGTPVANRPPRPQCAGWNGVALRELQVLRYGENPQQEAMLYKPVADQEIRWQVWGGKALSYNNLLDCDAMARLLRLYRESPPTAVIVKHLNPCGAAQGDSALQALKKAKRSDPRSHFGGIIGFNCPVDVQAAEDIRGDFAEVIVAPRYVPAALELLSQNKNLRIVELKTGTVVAPIEVRSVLDGVLVQQSDFRLSDLEEWEQASGTEVSSIERADLGFAWRLCSQVKSNAIVVVKDMSLLGVGAGQMSRIDSVEVALMKCRTHSHVVQGAVAASDAFFPFPDGLEALAGAGVRAIVAPRGAKRDADVVAAAKVHQVKLFFAPDRHFRH